MSGAKGGGMMPGGSGEGASSLSDRQRELAEYAGIILMEEGETFEQAERRQEREMRERGARRTGVTGEQTGQAPGQRPREVSGASSDSASRGGAPAADLEGARTGGRDRPAWTTWRDPGGVEWRITLDKLNRAANILLTEFDLRRMGTSAVGEIVLEIASRVVTVNLERRYCVCSCEDYRSSSEGDHHLCEHVVAALFIMGELGEREGIDLGLFSPLVPAIRNWLLFDGNPDTLAEDGKGRSEGWECRPPGDGRECDG